MFILFDSNVWISDLGLQSKNGAAVRHFARRREATVAIPEIVQLEVEEILTAHLMGLRKKIEDSYRQLLPVMRKLPKLHLPSEESIRKAVNNIIPDLDIPIRQIPFSEDVARSSMLKILREIPPSRAKNEQFRDGVIWAHCLDLLDEGNVYLVSKDKDFYELRDYNKGLAKALEQEVKQRSQTWQVKLMPCLSELLEEIRTPIEVNSDQIFKSVMAYRNEDIKELLTANGFDLCGFAKGEVACFATEEAQKIWVEFSFSHLCQDATGAGRDAGVLKLEGSGFLESETKYLYEVRLSRIRLDYPDSKPGGPTQGLISVSAHLNAPEVLQVRIPL